MSGTRIRKAAAHSYSAWVEALSPSAGTSRLSGSRSAGDSGSGVVASAIAAGSASSTVALRSTFRRTRSVTWRVEVRIVGLSARSQPEPSRCRCSANHAVTLTKSSSAFFNRDVERTAKPSSGAGVNRSVPAAMRSTSSCWSSSCWERSADVAPANSIEM